MTATELDLARAALSIAQASALTPHDSASLLRTAQSAITFMTTLPSVALELDRVRDERDQYRQALVDANQALNRARVEVERWTKRGLTAVDNRQKAQADLERLRSGIEDFVVHMVAEDRGRIAGREVAAHLNVILAGA